MCRGQILSPRSVSAISRAALPEQRGEYPIYWQSPPPSTKSFTPRPSGVGNHNHFGTPATFAVMAFIEPTMDKAALRGPHTTADPAA